MRCNWMRAWTLAFLALAGMGSAGAAQEQVLEARHCDRECLRSTVDRYLAAMLARQPSRAPFAPDIKFTENTAILSLTDGLWATAIGFEPGYALYVPDESTQQIGFIGIVRETAGPALLALRLKVMNRTITEAESIVVRDLESLQGFKAPHPALLEELAPEERVPREEMLRAVRSYFEGIERGSGADVPFDPECLRRENGRQVTRTTAVPDYPFLTRGRAPLDFQRMSCREQFDSGIFGYITSIERRRDPLVDERTGNVFGFFIFRHRGDVTTIEVPGHGKVSMPLAGRPWDTATAALFKLRGGRIWLVETMGTRMPYGLPNGWHPGQGRVSVVSPASDERGPIPEVCDRACLNGLVDRFLESIVAHDPSRLPLARNVKYTENGQVMSPGDGLWGTANARGRYSHYVADPEGGAVGFVGTIEEGGQLSILSVRMKIEYGWITEIEALVQRGQASAPGGPAALDAMTRKSVWDEPLAPEERVPRAKMIEIANAYFDKIERGRGNHPVPFDPECNRTENGLQTTNNPQLGGMAALGCEEQIATGMFVFDTELRDRRFVVIDEEMGVVYAHVFFDHAGTVKEWTHLQTGERHPVSKWLLRPSAWEIHELFKIRNGRIREIEAVLVDVPYRMRSNWEQ